MRGFAQLDDDLLTLLHPDSLIRQADQVAVLAWESDLSQQEGNDQDKVEISLYQDFYEICDTVSQSDRRQIFARRAQELKAPLESYDISDLKPITIISIERGIFWSCLRSCQRVYSGATPHRYSLCPSTYYWQL